MTLQSVSPVPSVPAVPATRAAGAVYLALIAAGLTAELALRGPLLSGPAPGAAIAAHSALFRASLGLDLLMMGLDIVLALLFYGLFRPVSAPLAGAALVFRLVQTALIGTGVIALTAAPGLAADGRAGALSRLLEVHATGYDVAQIFFAVSTGLTAVLLCRSGRAPALLPPALFAAALVYAAGGLLHVLAPSAHAAFQSAYLLPALAETGFALWLLTAARL